MKTRALVPVIFGVAMLGSCGPDKDVVEELAEDRLAAWANTNESYMDINQLLRDGNIDSAQRLIEGHLQHSVQEAVYAKEEISDNAFLRTNAEEALLETVDSMIYKMEEHLSSDPPLRNISDGFVHSYKHKHI